MQATATQASVPTLFSKGIAAGLSIRPFFSRSQFLTLAEVCDPKSSEEAEFFLRKLIDLAQQIDTMPKTYEQDGQGDQATVHLHYFQGGSDWFITEKDMDGGIEQAFGYAILNGDDECAELGYISIQEITAYGAELDLYFTPCTLGEIKAKRRQTDQAEAFNPNPWVLVNNPGQDDEDIVADFSTFAEAVIAKNEAGEGDIMKRLDDGTLTTEF
jgi:hypothetical protein